MNYFNLLPYAKETLTVPRHHYYLAGSIMLMLCCLWATHLWLVQQTDDLSEQLTSIKESIAQLTVKPTNQDTSSLYAATAKSTQNFFRELTKINALPICLTSISREKNTIQLIGNVRSANDLTKFLQHWPSKELFATAIIEKLQLSKTTGLIFNLKLIDTNPIFHVQKKPHVR